MRKSLSKKRYALSAHDTVVPFIQFQIPNVFAKINDLKYNWTTHLSDFWLYLVIILVKDTPLIYLQVTGCQNETGEANCEMMFLNREVWNKLKSI